MGKRLITIGTIVVAMVFMLSVVSFAAPYKVTVVVEPADGGTVEGAGEYAEGKNATLIATPNEGFTFAGWYKEDGTTSVSADPELHYDLEVSRTYVAKFEKALNVGVIAEPAEGGSVSQSGSGNYILDDAVTLTAISNEGYSFLGWFDASSPANAVSTDSVYTFNVTQPMSFIAKFAAQFRLDVNVWPEEGGTVKGAGKFAGGSIVMLEATPNKDYRFLGWFSPAEPDKVISKDEKYTFNLDSDLTYTAKFGRSYQYIWTWVILIGAIGAAGTIALMVLLRHMRTIKRSNVRPNSKKDTQSTMFFRNRDKKK